MVARSHHWYLNSITSVFARAITPYLQKIDFATPRIDNKQFENRKKLPWEHLSGCWFFFIFFFLYVPITFTVTTVSIVTVTIWSFEFCHNLIFWVLSQQNFFLVSSHLKFLSVVTILFVDSFFPLTIWAFEGFFHNWNFGVLTQFVFLSLVTIWFF